MTNSILHHDLYANALSNKWIVFIHGAGGSIQTWKKQIEHFKPHYNLLVLDLRDHGKSKNMLPDYPSYTFKYISEDVDKVLTANHIEHAHFIVLSFGSVLIQDFSARYPKKVDKIVVAGGLFGGNTFIRAFVHTARFFNLFLSYQSMYSVFSYLLMPRKRNQTARRVYQKYASDLTQTEYLKWVDLYDEFFQLLRKFRNDPLKHDMHIIMGGDDYVFLSAAKSFAQLHKRATLKILPKVGHICNIEAAEDFNKIATHYLKG